MHYDASEGPAEWEAPGDAPGPMMCDSCATIWYSRIAALIEQAGMHCAQCGGALHPAPTSRLSADR